MHLFLILILIAMVGLVITLLFVAKLMRANPIRAWNVNDDVIECIHISRDGKKMIAKRCHCEECEPMEGMSSRREPKIVPGEVVEESNVDEDVIVTPEMNGMVTMINGIPVDKYGNFMDRKEKGRWRWLRR